LEVAAVLFKKIYLSKLHFMEKLRVDKDIKQEMALSHSAKMYELLSNVNKLSLQRQLTDKMKFVFHFLWIFLKLILIIILC